MYRIHREIYYYPICDLPHKHEQCCIYFYQMIEQEKKVQEPKVNCIWTAHDENIEVSFQKDMDVAQTFLIQNTIGTNLPILKMKQDLPTSFLTKNKEMAIETKFDVNVSKLRCRDILNKLVKDHLKK